MKDSEIIVRLNVKNKILSEIFKKQLQYCMKEYNQADNQSLYSEL